MWPSITSPVGVFWIKLALCMSSPQSSLLFSAPSLFRAAPACGNVNQYSINTLYSYFLTKLDTAFSWCSNINQSKQFTASYWTQIIPIIQEATKIKRERIAYRSNPVNGIGLGWHVLYWLQMILYKQLPVHSNQISSSSTPLFLLQISYVLGKGLSPQNSTC
jgi:hypothetical protein